MTAAQLVGPSFLAGATPLAAVKQWANVASMYCQQVGKPQLGSWGLLKVTLAADMTLSGRWLATSCASGRCSLCFFDAVGTTAGYYITNV